MKKSILTMCVLYFLCAVGLRAAAPVVSYIRASQQAGTKLVDIYYDVSASTSTLTIAVQVSADGGLTYTIPAVTFSGAVGAGVAPGAGNHIVWNAGADWNGQWVPSCVARVTANDGITPPPPPGMAYIPAGTFQMGDSFYENSSDELPLHNVQVSGFFSAGGLDRRTLRDHRDLLRHHTQLKDQISHRKAFFGCQEDATALQRLETLFRGNDAVFSGRNIREYEIADFIRPAATFRTRGHVYELRLSVRHRRSAGIPDRT